jgi:hypothetical protein
LNDAGRADGFTPVEGRSQANCLQPGSASGAVSLARHSDATRVHPVRGNITAPQIFVDGRKHPDDPDPTLRPLIGHYEGQTLVVDTRQVQRQVLVDFRGHPPGEAAHARALRARTRLLAVETTIDDPTYYAKPFTIKLRRACVPAKS